MEDMSMYEDYATSAAEPDVVKTKEENLYHILQCNVCNEEITGFRYTCVQCSDFDLCSSCETNKAHHHHYVLRVPHPTPNEELEAVLTVIRLHLLKDLDPIKDPEPETIIVKIEETTEESILPGELVEEEDKPEEMDKIIHARVPQTEQDTCSVDANKSASYKCCAVPMCLNTTVKTPKKLFINVPTRKSVRDNWLKLARRDPTTVNRISTLHFCQDHFDLPNDMVNYMQYHIMGSVSQIRMKSGCVPSKFDCHPDWGRLNAQELYILEKQRKLMIQDCDGVPHGIGATNRIITEPKISKTADKWIQVYFKRSKFRSKATQTRNKDLNTSTPEEPIQERRGPSNETNTMRQRKQVRKRTVEKPTATTSDSASTSILVQLAGKKQELRVVAGNLIEAKTVADRVGTSSRPRPIILRRRVTRPPDQQLRVILQRQQLSDDRTNPATHIT